MATLKKSKSPSRAVSFVIVATACLSETALSFCPVSFPPTNPTKVLLTRLFLSGASGDNQDPTGPLSTNVLGTALQSCCSDVGGTGIGTGFYRNGYCPTGEQDLGRHTVCVQVTDEFLEFSASVGNDLSTRMPQYMFPGLKEGDIWCLCAQRWPQAFQAGKARKLFLQATHEKTLDYVSFEILREYALDKEEADRRLDDLNEQRERLKKLL